MGKQGGSMEQLAEEDLRDEAAEVRALARNARRHRDRKKTVWSPACASFPTAVKKRSGSNSGGSGASRRRSRRGLCMSGLLY